MWAGVEDSELGASVFGDVEVTRNLWVTLTHRDGGVMEGLDVPQGNRVLQEAGGGGHES